MWDRRCAKQDTLFTIIVYRENVFREGFGGGFTNGGDSVSMGSPAPAEKFSSGGRCAILKLDAGSVSAIESVGALKGRTSAPAFEDTIFRFFIFFVLDAMAELYASSSLWRGIIGVEVVFIFIFNYTMPAYLLILALFIFWNGPTHPFLGSAFNLGRGRNRDQWHWAGDRGPRRVWYHSPG